MLFLLLCALSDPRMDALSTAIIASDKDLRNHDKDLRNHLRHDHNQGGWRAAVGQARAARTGGVESKVSSTVDEAEGLVCWSLARRASGRGHGVEGGQVVPRGQHTLHADVRCSRDVSA